MSSRRNFLKTLGLGGLFLGTGVMPKEVRAGNKMQKITILHTNDLHSHIDPFPKTDGRYGGLGGFKRIYSLVKKIRKEEKNVLLFDAGDVFQGTPYFNFYKGEAEYRLMSRIGYDAGTIGNHEFDNGLEGIAKQLPNAQFPLVNSNYDFSDTILNGKIEPYKIFQRGSLRIGVFGLGINMEGLVDARNYGNAQYQDPVNVANKMSSLLRNDHGCDLVVCLSHLGYKYKNGMICDASLVPQTRGIDLIVGGHSHTYLDTADRVRDMDGKEVVVNQVGWAGIALGRIDFYFESDSNTALASCSNYSVDKTIV